MNYFVQERDALVNRYFRNTNKPRVTLAPSKDQFPEVRVQGNQYAI